MNESKSLGKFIYYPNKGFFSVIDYISFSVFSFIFGIFIKCDIIIATSPQFFTAISGSMLSLFKQKPWVMEVRDLWPDSIVAVGSMKKNSLVFNFLKKIEKYLYVNASVVAVVTNSFKEYLINEMKINPNKIGVFKRSIKKIF